MAASSIIDSNKLATGLTKMVKDKASDALASASDLVTNPLSGFKGAGETAKALGVDSSFVDSIFKFFTDLWKPVGDVIKSCIDSISAACGLTPAAEAVPAEVPAATPAPAEPSPTPAPGTTPKVTPSTAPQNRKAGRK